jgi:cell fate regulator YaaT (PSP1 superfamily)
MDEKEHFGRACQLDFEAVFNNSAVSEKQIDGCAKLNAYNWLKNTYQNPREFDMVEVMFKNTRKAYFNNVNHLRLSKGDIIAVEASPGHDIGIVSLTGDLVFVQMAKANIPLDENNLKKVYRKAKPVDLEKWKDSILLEHQTMLKARSFADDFQLNMKIGDVEYQGDKTKAIFYYIADERVDFRELIKVLAGEFKVRIEMKQIGARQEAGRIGGLGPCGRELCCSTWITSFVSVTTSSARYQELSLNPQKLAGQCGKLKCCLNYELACYVDMQKDFPDVSKPLEAEEGSAFHQKTDVFNRTMWYSFDSEGGGNLIPLTVDRVKEIITSNQAGRKVKKLGVEDHRVEKMTGFSDGAAQDSLDRFKKTSTKSKKRKKKHTRRNPENN